ncbi:unnamed protein product [Dicrocoelium dendriticum]|nr:unnamed protein product [Dicrocoelium dendriticum]
MSPQNLIRFLTTCGRLKRTTRTGWTRYDIDQPESVADHMYRMALMAVVLPATERHDVSLERLLKMTLVHDLAECIVGDITPHCNVSKEDKLAREEKAMNELCQLLPDLNATEVLSLWNEYNAQQTDVSRLCKDFDKFDMLLQAFEYEQETDRRVNLDEFFHSTIGTFTTPLVKSWIEELSSMRAALHKHTESSCHN